MTAWVPADQAVRLQVAGDGDRTFLVEAGAGTGKTELMVFRVVSMIRRGQATAEGLVVITFTDAAAAEIAARTRQALEILDAGTDAEVRATRMEPLAGDERERVRAALDGIHRARIQTIHAFCSSLLRERPVEAGLDPGFATLDDMQAAAHVDQAFDAWFHEVLDNPPEGLAVALDHGLGPRKVRVLADMLHAHRAVLPMAVPPVPAPMPAIAPFVATLLSSADNLRVLVAGCAPGDPARDDIGGITTLADQVRLLEEEGDEAGIVRVLLTQAPALRHGVGTLGAWGDPDDGREATRLRKQVREDLEALQGELGTAVIMGLLPVVEDFVLDYAGRRRRDGVATYDDLLLWTRDLLDDPAARAYFRRHITRIIVDEFQDTDPVQAEIVFCLAGSGDPPPGGDWTTLPPRDGVLTVVGDPKQSIYRFRRADLAVFDRIGTGVMAPHRVQISQNFRSREGILAWVNRVFDVQFVEEPGIQPANTPLVHAPRAEEFDAPAVHVAWADRHEKIDPARHAEADLLARMLVLARTEGWRVFDAGQGAVRPITWGDMVVLVPAWVGFDEYRLALRRMGVPFRVGGGKGFFGREEVGDLCHLLEAVHDPLDDIAVAAALRSPIFGCSDDELLLAVGTGRGINYRQYPTKECPPRVADGLRIIREMHDALPRRSLVEAVTVAVDRSLLVEQALARPGDDQAAANLLKVIDMARRFADIGAVAGVRDFARWMGTQREIEDDDLRASVREGDAGIADAGDDVVRVMTIHASKGLEFPLVALANLCGRRNIRRGAFPDRIAGRVHLRIPGSGENHFETVGYADAWVPEKAAQEAETTRLMYVAATRARDHLLVPLAMEPGKMGRDAKQVVPHLPDWAPIHHLEPAGGPVRVLAPEVLAAVEALPVGEAEEPDTGQVTAAGAGRGEWEAARRALIADASVEMLVVAATTHDADASRRNEDGLQDDSLADAEPGPVMVGRSGTSVDTEATRTGRALHLVMEWIDFAAPGDRNAIVHRACAAEGAEGHEAAVRGWVDTCLASDAVARALGADEMHREVPFTIAAGDGFEVGRIDLLIREGDEITVIDWKSDRVDPGSEQAHAEAVHRGQADAYVRALRASAPDLSVKEVIFVFARTGGEASLAPTGLF